MSQLEDLLSFNQKFVAEHAYRSYEAPSRPTKKMTIVSCMDCRLIELLPKALNVKNGDAIMLKTAGGMVESPYSNTMKSILVSLYELGSEAVYIIGHTDCGMHGLKSDKMIQDIKARGIMDKQFAEVGIDVREWLNGFQTVENEVQKSVSIVKSHPLLPEDTPVIGLVIDPKTGELKQV
ncbi:beta-class carbonic anhydrase [Sporolactobacillus terrae]|uniref:carbonic anhydrase n=1 Tax=Sporolactobacillus terrae TaxID=269673 RepID=A0A410DAJ7_9BACL|nr:carbonic anhydrase [Sporolactobacillus terrae]QAA23112.1 carbonic anhydrase [Sporolactobacillus terrae]QAA26083.1 carbonic anhydrase [Sporolactobacillus terrae]UAK15178.1 carbonic anhydrase [Sporolactobacillus terrae]BBN99526.1 carbonic anhydrase [Sporolactobacillus terrae]